MTKRLAENDLLQTFKMFDEQEKALDGLIQVNNRLTEANNRLHTEVAEYKKMSIVENSEAVIQVVTNILSKREAHNLRIKKSREMIG